jgi:hypothetical protein
MLRDFAIVVFVTSIALAPQALATYLELRSRRQQTTEA